MSEPTAPTSPPPAATATSTGRFGAFAGVFTPSILTILGVVMFLRFGWVVGNSGLVGVLLVVVISHLISLATGLSIASIATNRTVGAGGAYFMVSRSLGAPAGAAIGIPLFFGQALSVTFYIVGFTESITQIFPEVPEQVVGTIVNVGLTALSLKSAELAIKAQYFVMGAIVLSLASFFAGSSPEPLASIDLFAPEGSASFSEVFAVFFPAVTGIMAGVSMSGDLKDPRTAIPKGTLYAILIGFIVYTTFPIWLSMNFSAAYMADRDNSNVVWTLSRIPALIYVGVWGATLSSALGSVLTAPRTLQALAMDGLAPKVFAKGYGPSNEPRAGIGLTFIIAQIGIFFGSLDAIAPILTMFFLATYGVTNLGCGLEKWAASPSFRPSFKVPAWVGLFGGLACFYVMSIIDMVAMIIAMVISVSIYLVVQRRVLGTAYGDARHGIWSAMVRSALQHLRKTSWHGQNWRPNLIILGGHPKERPHLLELGSAIVQDSGLVTYFYLIRGNVDKNAASRFDLQREIDERVALEHPNVFCRVDIVDDIYRGVISVSQSYGIGTFEANTVMLGWLRTPERAEEYVQMLRDLSLLGRSIVLVRWDPKRRYGLNRRIHIWWGGLANNGGLMLLLAMLLRGNDAWRNSVVTLLTVVDDDQAKERAEAAIRRVLGEARLVATVRVILRQGRTIPQIMHAESAEADLAIVGLHIPERGHLAEEFFARNDELLSELPTTIMVHGARELDSEVVLFDSPAVAAEDTEQERRDPTPIREI